MRMLHQIHGTVLRGPHYATSIHIAASHSLHGTHRTPPPHSTSMPCPRLSRLASTPAAGSFAVARELPAWSLIVAHGFCL